MLDDAISTATAPLEAAEATVSGDITNFNAALDALSAAALADFQFRKFRGFKIPVSA